MNAEKYLKEKEWLSQALNGEENLKNAVTDITAVLKKFNLDAQPRTAFDFMIFTLETIHLEKFTVSDFVQ